MKLISPHTIAFVSLFTTPLLSIAVPTMPAENDWGYRITQAFEASRNYDSKSSVVVAVIDTGTDRHHPDLKDSMWKNQGEIGKDNQGRDKSTNGVDDDSNGFVDDVYGWNFADRNNDISDRHGHGTHVSGIVAGSGRGPGGMKGIAPNARLMILKYYDPNSRPTDNLGNSIQAIRYAIRMKADIINYSGGGLDRSREEEDVLREAQRQGILLVAAAGNEGVNSDRLGYFPADYDFSNIVSVTAMDKSRNLLPTSNYGSKTVDIAAPGKLVRSTLPHGEYGSMTGTSQATAFVTGVAALLMSREEYRGQPQRVIRQILATGTTEPGFRGKMKVPVRVNAYQALVMKGRARFPDRS